MSRQAREQMDGVTISIASEPRGEGAVMVVVDVIGNIDNDGGGGSE